MVPCVTVVEDKDAGMAVTVANDARLAEGSVPSWCGNSVGEEVEVGIV